MNVDKWFFSLIRAYQILLLVFPPVGIVMLILIRLSNIIRKPTMYNIIGLVLTLLLNAIPVFWAFDFIFFLIKKTFLFYEGEEKIGSF